MLYTGKGDNGTTKLFACDQRVSKSSAISEALGSVDEINSLLGVVKIKGGETEALLGVSYLALLSDVQQDLFIVQAELAGADKKMDTGRVKKLEELVNDIEKELPPIKSFFVSGGTELGALCDYARTIARRAERRVVAALEKPVTKVKKEKKAKDGVETPAAPEVAPTEKPPIFAYLNRLSSLLYALARLANHQAGITEDKPHY